MGVHANTKGETKLYLSCFGRLVFGDAEYFPPADKFSLDPLIEDGAKSLLCEDVEGLEKIRLVEYRRYWGGAYKEIEIRKASDISAALAARQPYPCFVLKRSIRSLCSNTAGKSP